MGLNQNEVSDCAAEREALRCCRPSPDRGVLADAKTFIHVETLTHFAPGPNVLHNAV